MMKFIKKTKRKSPLLTTLTLPWEMRIKSRQKVSLDDGTTAGLFLSRGEILRRGDMLATEDGYLIEILATKEMVSIAHADSARQLNLACYHLGNRHVELEIGSNWVSYRHDHALDEMVTRLGLNVKIRKRPFEPEHNAY